MNRPRDNAALEKLDQWLELNDATIVGQFTQQGETGPAFIIEFWTIRDHAHLIVAKHASGFFDVFRPVSEDVDVDVMLRALDTYVSTRPTLKRDGL